MGGLFVSALKYVVKALTYVIFNLFWRLRPENPEPGREKVLVQINSGIGDGIMALPMINELARLGFEVHAVVNQYTEALARLCPDIKEYHHINYDISNIFKMLKLWPQLNRHKFAYFVGALPSNLSRDAFLPILLRIPTRIKHVSPHKEFYRNYDFVFNCLLDIDYSRNNTESNLRLLSFIRKEAGAYQGRHHIVLPEETVSRARLKLRDQGYTEGKFALGLHPGCKETWAFKRWPADNFSDLIVRLEKNFDLQIVLFGGPEEKPLADQILQNLVSSSINMVGKLSLEETMAAISLCSMFISNDSALMHVATLFNLPVIALFGRTNEIATGPYGKKHVIIKKKEVQDISVQEVYYVAADLVSSLKNTRV